MAMRPRAIASTTAALCGYALTLSPLAQATDARTAWADLWRTPDQQGQALLEAGDPAAAARRFEDPRRRAYADLEAGNYQDAAKLLAPFDDPESEYNRGNALAGTGQLQAALAAYDAALKQDPADKDIRHNRDLVERALRQQRPSPSASPNGRPGGHGAGSPGQQPQSSGAASRHGGSAARQSGGSSPSGASGPQSSGSPDSGSNGARPGNARPRSGGSQDSSDGARSDAALAAAYARREQQRTGTGRTPQTPGAQRNGSSGALPKSAGSEAGGRRLLAGGTETPRQKPETEKQLALDQWLRQIPDSPAGLLQRKFLIEHMMKQDNGNPEDGD
jgi:Ca-activated chloride channel family protein